MATTSLPRAATRGGSFLVDACSPEDVFTPADLTDDQKLIGRTAEEFVRNEVVPLIADLEQHKPNLLAQLLKKAGEIGLLGGGVPEEYGGAGLDKVSSVQLAENLSAYASFGVSHGGHAGIGTLPIVFFGTQEQKKKYLPSLATGEKLAAYCLSEPQAGAFAGRTLLDPERAEDVDHQRRLRGRVHRIRESRRRKILLLHCRARVSRFFIGRGRKKDGPQGQLDHSPVF
jgi:alkylation response protein AidB-like acyl-CoA dehydrogenase